MRIALISASVLAISAMAAHADDVMANFYGNTLVLTGGTYDSKIHFKADHTFEMKVATYDLKGTWKIDKKGQLCRTYENPPPGVPNPFCMPIASHATGESWTIEVSGQTRNATLVGGIR